MVAHLRQQDITSTQHDESLVTTPGMDTSPQSERSSAKAAALAALPGRPLTARERECLAWSAEGKTAWETGVILGISDQTVISHLRNAQRKMRAANRVQAVAMAIRAGLLEDVVEVPGDHGPVVIGDPVGR
jgi:DNA-binding CsgD family transcriptional regulator